MMWELMEARRGLSLVLEQQAHSASLADQSLSAAARRLLKAADQITTRMAVQTANRGSSTGP